MAFLQQAAGSAVNDLDNMQTFSMPTKAIEKLTAYKKFPALGTAFFNRKSLLASLATISGNGHHFSCFVLRIERDSLSRSYIRSHS